MAPAVEKIEFARTIEGLFQKGLAAELDAALMAKLKVAGLDLNRPLLPGYPAADFHRWVQIAATHIHPHLPVDEAVRLVGRRSVPGLEDTLIGRALSSGLKLIGPRRAMERVQRIFRNNGNYQEVKVISMHEHGGRLAITDVFGLPTYYQGIFEAAAPLIGAKNAKITLAASPPPSATLDISWDV